MLNLGVLYHVTDPLRLMQRTYELCERFAIVDTICHEEPFSGFVLFDTKDASHPHEGRESWEFHPTYRGAIDALRYAGFREVIEIVADRRHRDRAVPRRRAPVLPRGEVTAAAQPGARSVIESTPAGAGPLPSSLLLPTFELCGPVRASTMVIEKLPGLVSPGVMPGGLLSMLAKS